MMTKIFFSWQSETPRKIGKTLIHDALDLAIDQLVQDVEIKEAIREGMATDSDTQGVPGSPPIVETILAKIDEAAVFVADLTFTGTRLDGRPTPNPNVLIEYGWAAKSLSLERVVAVMNTAYGMPSQENMPFDLVHRRFPIRFYCQEGCSPDERKTALRGLVKDLAHAIKAVLQQRNPAAERARFQAKEPEHGRSYFRGVNPVGQQFSRISPVGRPVYLHPHHAMWLRLMPVFQQDESFSTLQLEEALEPAQWMPCPLNWSTDSALRKVRGPDGFGWFVDLMPDQEAVPAVFYAFQTGEIWSVDTVYAATNGVTYFDEKKFERCLRDGLKVLEQLGLEGPFQWIAGIEGVATRPLMSPYMTRSLVPHTFGPNLVERIGEVADVDADPAETLAPFFRAVFEAAHVEWKPFTGTLVQ